MSADATTGPAKTLSDDIAAVYAWWREAGVETGFSDEPCRWLRAVEPETAPASASARQPRTPEAAARTPPTDTGKEGRRSEPGLGGDRGHWPQAHSDFAEWWLTEPTLGLAGDGRRVPPRGPCGADLMVLVPQPEAGDVKRLLDGREGKLLVAMLAAIGFGEEQVYVASVLPARAGLIDWTLLQERGMSQVLGHHVRLASPKRLLVLGRDGIWPLLGHDPAQTAEAPPYFHHDVWQLQVACAPSLAELLERPRRKAKVWRTLLEWGG